MNTQIKFKLGITFGACFPDEHRRSLNEYLEEYVVDTLLKIGSHFLGFYTEKSTYSDVLALMNMFFSQGNQNFTKVSY